MTAQPSGDDVTGTAAEPRAKQQPKTEAGAHTGPQPETEPGAVAGQQPGQQDEAHAEEVVERHVELLTEPRDGLPPLVTSAADLAAATAALAGGTGPVAVDAERASGFRYGHRAFLVQLRRQGAGTVLIDPVACPDLSGLDAALADTEAVLHAASQDLPCLAELGYRPRHLFDTEVAGRLLGCPRVGLATMVESNLGLGLEKTHSAADWSTRPLPDEWLRYAALDVEVLVELRDVLAEQLTEQGKIEWANQEFAAVLAAAAAPPPPRTDPWRRTSGIHRVRTRRGLAVVRELWQERDKIAKRRDISPTKVLSDAAIVEAARIMPSGPTSSPRSLAFPRAARAVICPNGYGPSARPEQCPTARSRHRLRHPATGRRLRTAGKIAIRKLRSD